MSAASSSPILPSLWIVSRSCLVRICSPILALGKMIWSFGPSTSIVFTMVRLRMIAVLVKKFVGPMFPLVIKWIITYWNNLPASSRGFQSEFSKKAWSDLLAYEEIKAANEANLADLLERPYDDIVTEEIIDQLPGPKVEDLTPDETLKVKVERVPMETESTDPEQMDMEGGSMEPGSVAPQAEEDDVKMEDATGQEPSPSKKPRTSSDPAAASSEKERGSMEPESFGDLGGDRDAFINLPKIKHEDAEEILKKKATSAPTASKGSGVNNSFVETSKKEAEEDGGLKNLPEYQDFLDNGQQVERTSPTFLLANQNHGPGMASTTTTDGKIPCTGSSSNTCPSETLTFSPASCSRSISRLKEIFGTA